MAKKQNHPVAGFDHGARVAAAAHDVRAGDGDMVGLRHDEIRPSPLNPRKTFDEEALAELAESIASSGLLQNLVVRPRAGGGYELVAGERRWRAIGRLIEEESWGEDTPIACRVVDVFDDHDARIMAIVENLQRRDIAPMEEARALHGLKEGGMSVPDIATAIGKSRRHVETRIALVTRLAPEAQAALDAGAINLNQARELLPAAPDVQATLAKKLANPETPTWATSVDAIRGEVRRELIPADRAIFDVEASGIEIVEDTQGHRMMPKAAFLAAQQAAVEARVKVLEAEYAWVKVVEWFYAGRWDSAETLGRRPEEGGAIVVFCRSTGDMAEHVGLFDRGEREKAEREAADARMAQEYDRRDRAREALAAEISMALTPARGLAAVLAALIVEAQYGNLIQVELSPADDIRAAISARLGIVGDNVTIADVFRGVAKLDRNEIIDMLAEAGRTLIEIDRYRIAQASDIALAAALGIGIPAVLLPETDEKEG